MQRKNNYTAIEVEKIVSDIIHQDSFGDIHYRAGIVGRELNMDFSKKDEEEAEEAEETSWRTLVRIIGVNERYIWVVVPAWNPGVPGALEKTDLPEWLQNIELKDDIRDDEKCSQFKDKGKIYRCHARVNIDAESADKLTFTHWEKQ